jgi:hypothetical protein
MLVLIFSVADAKLFFSLFCISMVHDDFISIDEIQQFLFESNATQECS